MSFCICCHGSLLRHFRHSSVYWFCPSCRQEMPQLKSTADKAAAESALANYVIANR